MAEPESEVARRHVTRWRKLKGRRGTWEQHWENCARVMLPRRRGFTETVVTGSSRVDNLYDGSGMLAARGLANAIGGLVWPDGQDTFRLRPSDDNIVLDDEGTDWIADSEERLRQAMDDPKALFRQARGESFLDLVTFGTSVKFINESTTLSHLFFKCMHLKYVTPIFDHEGNAIGIYNHQMMTVEQAVDRFGLGKVSEETREQYRLNQFDKDVEFLQVVTRRARSRPDAVFVTDMAYTDLWIEVKALKEVEERGFPEFPFVLSMWDTSSGEDYGRSPGMIALPDVNTLQAMGETLLVAGQRAATPPFAAPADGSFNEMNTFPGGITYYNPELLATIRGSPYFPLETGSNMPLTLQMQEAMREQVFRAFFRNVLNLPLDGPQMTATEVMERKEEFIREIGPVFGRLESTDTAPTVEKSFRLMLRLKALKPVPQSLSGKAVRFEYESPVRRIRQQIEARAAEMWAQEAIVVSEVKPDVLDNINFDELERFKHAALGLPHELLNSAEEVAQIRQERVKREAEAAKRQQTLEATQAAAQGAQALDRMGSGVDKLDQVASRPAEEAA